MFHLTDRYSKQKGRIFFLACSLLVAACQDEPEYGGFSTTTGGGMEGIGAQSVTIDLGGTTSGSTVITYRVGGNASLDGDYRITTLTNYYSDALTVTVPAGKSTATIEFEIIDDNQVEPGGEIIYFEITSVSDATLAANFRKRYFVYQIDDNDEAPDSGMQVDLSWNLGDGVRINASNFDLYLADTISVGTDGAVISYHVAEETASANENGFETITIPVELPDKQYYIMIEYVSGEYTAELTLQFSSRQTQRAASGRVSSTSIGRVLYYGPITKTGQVFSFR